MATEQPANEKQDAESASREDTVGLAKVHDRVEDGVIVELRPKGFDTAAERDMSHLSDAKAQELHEQLDDYLHGGD